jgi:hypothetical protein
MKTMGMVMAMMMVAAIGAHAGSITIQKLNGEVAVRHGVTEVWATVAAGDALRPNDSMRTGKNGSATLVVQDGQGSATRRLVLPADVIVDLSDVRDLTQEELMLKLTMQKVRATPEQKRDGNPAISDAAVMHGSDASRHPAMAENDPQVGRSLLNGAKVLLDNGFSATAVLRTLEVFRSFPSLAGIVDNRLALAGAMEKANLRGEAVAEYNAIRQMGNLSSSQAAMVSARIEALRKRN